MYVIVAGGQLALDRQVPGGGGVQRGRRLPTDVRPQSRRLRAALPTHEHVSSTVDYVQLHELGIAW